MSRLSDAKCDICSKWKPKWLRVSRLYEVGRSDVPMELHICGPQCLINLADQYASELKTSAAVKKASVGVSQEGTP